MSRYAHIQSVTFSQWIHRLSKTEAHLLLYLWGSADGDTGVVRAGVRVIVGATGVDSKGVRRGLAGLEDHGLIERLEVGKSRCAPSVWRLLIAPGSSVNEGHQVPTVDGHNVGHQMPTVTEDNVGHQVPTVGKERGVSDAHGRPGNEGHQVPTVAGGNVGHQMPTVGGEPWASDAHGDTGMLKPTHMGPAVASPAPDVCDVNSLVREGMLLEAGLRGLNLRRLVLERTIPDERIRQVTEHAKRAGKGAGWVVRALDEDWPIDDDVSSGGPTLPPAQYGAPIGPRPLTEEEIQSQAVDELVLEWLGALSDDEVERLKAAALADDSIPGIRSIRRFEADQDWRTKPHLRRLIYERAVGNLAVA